MSPEITDESFDIALALGLFGGLLVETAKRSREFQRILRECLRVLKGDGLLVVGNSCERQPAKEFIDDAQKIGFRSIECTRPRRTIGIGNQKHADMRYLLVLQKP
jgi:hypothetical protein